MSSSRPGVRWRGYAVRAMALAGLVLAGAACSGSPAVPRGSVSSCTQFGVAAIQHHVTVTAVPDACRGLSQIEVNTAVGRALRTMAAGGHGKVAQRELIASDSSYLAGLIHATPVAGSSGVAAPLSGPPSRTALSLAALAAWLVTVGLGISMMARWIARAWRRGAPSGRTRGPVLNFTHFGLALAGLLTWTCYLITGVTGLAWAACGLLIAVAALGMTLVFSVLVTTARLGDDPPTDTGHPPVLVIAAHITVACLTILLAMLAAIGSG